MNRKKHTNFFGHTLICFHVAPVALFKGTLFVLIWMALSMFRFMLRMSAFAEKMPHNNVFPCGTAETAAPCQAINNKVVKLPLPNEARQQRAIELLITGTSVTDTAKSVGVDPRTLRRWQVDPHFQAEFNRQRLNIHESAQLRLHGMTHKAIDVMAKALNDGNLRAAIELLKIVGVGNIAAKIDTETDPEQLVRRQAEKMAVEAYTAEPFASVVPGNESVTALGRDIAKILRERYQVESVLDGLVE